MFNTKPQNNHQTSLSQEDILANIRKRLSGESVNNQQAYSQQQAQPQAQRREEQVQQQNSNVTHLRNTPQEQQDSWDLDFSYDEFNQGTDLLHKPQANSADSVYRAYNTVGKSTQKDSFENWNFEDDNSANLSEEFQEESFQEEIEEENTHEELNLDLWNDEEEIQQNSYQEFNNTQLQQQPSQNQQLRQNNALQPAINEEMKENLQNTIMNSVVSMLEKSFSEEKMQNILNHALNSYIAEIMQGQENSELMIKAEIQNWCNQNIAQMCREVIREELYKKSN